VPSPSNPQSPTPNPFGKPLYACLYRPPALDHSAASASTLVDIAQQFSPRYERHRDDLVSIDVTGLGHLLGPAPVIGEELQRDATSRGLHPHIAIGGTRMAAMLVALARPGLTVIECGGEAEALAPITVGLLATINFQVSTFSAERSELRLETLQRWGLRTLGELAALPPADLVARLGRQALTWQAMARGEDIRPLVPTLEEERFESSLDLEWPIEGLEPLSFVLTRLLEPLSTRLERRDRGAAVLHVVLRLVTRQEYARRLQLPSPLRDVRTLRTLALLDLESHPPDAAIDRVAVIIDPTPGRVLQHTLFTRAHPTPEQLSTLVARLGALMGHDRFGAPAVVDTYRPGAFAMTAFATEHKPDTRKSEVRSLKSEGEDTSDFRLQTSNFSGVVSALRRCRQPVPARVAMADGRPVRVTTDRRGFAGGAVTRCAGPWRSSGNWWNTATGKSEVGSLKSESPSVSRTPVSQTSDFRLQTSRAWNRDEWDVALNDGAVYRIVQDRVTEAWFIDAIVD
jgi:protein ImuB